MKKERICWLDYLRVFALFGTLMIHVCASKWNDIDITTGDWFWLNAYMTFSRHAVPIFVMISGALMIDIKRELDIKKLFITKISRLVAALIFWSVLYSIVVTLTSQNHSRKEFIIRVMEGHYHLWFMYMIIGIYISLPIIRQIYKCKLVANYYIILALIFYFLPNLIRKAIPSLNEVIGEIITNANLQIFFGFIPYFILGKILTEVHLKKEVRNCIYMLGIVSRLVTLGLTQIYSLNEGVALQSFYSNNLITTLLTAVAIFVFFKYEISSIKISNVLARVMMSVSKYSFGIYLVHELFNILFAEINFSILTYPMILSVPGNTIIVLILSYITIFCISKIPVIRNYIL